MPLKALNCPNRVPIPTVIKTCRMNRPANRKQLGLFTFGYCSSAFSPSASAAGTLLPQRISRDFQPGSLVA